MNDPIAAFARAEYAIARLRAVAAASEGEVRLGPGIPDEVIGTWLVPVPADIRLLAREIGEIWFDDYDPITFGHPENFEPTFCRAGAPGTWWALHSNTAAENYYADIDSETGAWGRVFYHWEDNSSTLVAPSVTDWFTSLADGLQLALRVAAGERVEGLDPGLDDDDLGGFDFESVFQDWWSGHGEIIASPDSPKAAAMAAPTARHSPDAALATAAADLPDGAVLADLRTAQFPTFISFNEFRSGTARYRRFAGGTFLAAIPSGS
ncbi:hypothetical protein [Nocardia gipuzkoensis]|uniref:hypothetical protein n=1 Tax=Nocardia gipuzkoensis TaxID=2749991 RepID=UPI003EE17AF9